jgi:hypothetical protein
MMAPGDDQLQKLKLNAQVIINLKNLRLQNMHEKSPPPTRVRRRMELEYQDWARVQGTEGTTHRRRTQRPLSGPGMADVVLLEHGRGTTKNLGSLRDGQ